MAGRIVAVIALAVAAVGVALLLMGGGDKYEVTASFENASQLVEGNEVVIAGDAVGTVGKIELGENGEALVTFSVEDEFAPLKRGTTATVRSYSLSGIANRQVQLTLPPSESAGEQIPDGGTMDQSETVSEVDLDEIFNTLDDRTVRNLKKVIKGFEISYDGVGPQANRGFKYLNPFLSTSRQLFSELNYDERALEQLLVDGSQLSGALAERAPDLAALIQNLNGMMGALASQKAALAESIAKFPDFMRQANTTFVNLRAALDDVDPLIDASKPVATRLRPFMAELRAASADAVPTLRDLDQIISQPGGGNDLIELTRANVPLARAAIGSGAPDCGSNPERDAERAADGDFSQGSFGESVCALRNGLPQLAHFRPYTTELVGWFDDFTGRTAAIDAQGGVARIETTFNTFSFSPTSGLPVVSQPPKPFSDPTNLDLIKTGYTSKCPGANERPLGAADPADDSVPFFEDPSSPYTDPINCDPSQVQPGP